MSFFGLETQFHELSGDTSNSLLCTGILCKTFSLELAFFLYYLNKQPDVFLTRSFLMSYFYTGRQKYGISRQVHQPFLFFFLLVFAGVTQGIYLTNLDSPNQESVGIKYCIILCGSLIVT